MHVRPGRPAPHPELWFSLHLTVQCIDEPGVQIDLLCLQRRCRWSASPVRLTSRSKAESSQAAISASGSGLGGAQFRLPLLIGPFGFAALKR